MTQKLSKFVQGSDGKAKYKVAGQSATTSMDNRIRKEIRLTLPAYTQTFDVTTLLDVPHMRSAVFGQQYRIYSSDNKILAEGTMNELSGTVRTKSSTPVRCEIGAGSWSVVQDSYDYEDVENIFPDGGQPP
jgi:hypothetical protein